MKDEKQGMKGIPEEELKEIASGARTSVWIRECYECEKDAEIRGIVLRNKKTGDLLNTKFPNPLCQECAQKKLELYSPEEWELDSWQFYPNRKA